MSSPPFRLTRCQNPTGARHNGRIVALLKTLGVPRQLLYVRRIRKNGSFWMRDINHLQILERARQMQAGTAPTPSTQVACHDSDFR
jgi:hypothetical protein